MNETRQVVVLTTIAFLMFVFGKNVTDDELPTGKQFVAWGLLFVTLVALSDFDTTAQLAAALAILIALTVFLTYGVDFFARLSQSVGGSGASGTGGGRVGGGNIPL